MAEAAAIAAINFVKGAAAYFGATLTTAQAAAIINATTYLVASVGVNAYLSSQREFPNQGRALQLGIAPDMPRRWQVGRRGNAGILVDWHVNGNKNQFLWIVKYLHEGPAAPINEIVADGRTVWTGTLNHGQSVELTEFRSPDERFRVHFHDGRVGQTAPTTLTSQGFVGATYRGTGCAHIIEQLKWDPDTVPAPPAMVYVSDGSHFYDRRLDGTQGGSGSHRLLDPSTWAPTKTPAVALDHYLLGNYWPGMSRPRMGVGLDYDDVPYDRFAANANLCEELESSSFFGNQQRYEANGFIQADQVHADIITELCKAMDARPADFGGRVSAISHDAKTAIMTITDDDLEEGGTEVYDPKRSWGQLVGGAQGTYQDPDNNYQPTEYPRVEDSAWETEDGGETKTASLPLPFETNPTRAQRLARLFVNRERRQATLGGLYHPRTIELEEGDWFIRQGARFPSGKVFEVVEPPQLNPQTLAVTLSALEVDPTDSAWNTANEQQADIPVGDTNDSPPSLPVPNVTFTVFSWAHETFAFASINFNHTEFADAPLDIDIELATSDGAGAPEADTRIIDVKIAAGRQYSSYAGLLPNRSYVVRTRSRGATRRSDWSAWTQFNSSASGSYGAIGDGTATLGSNVYREDGLTLVGDNDAITGLGISAGFTGQGGLATLNNFSWGSGLLTGIPTELNDGRITAGLDAAGDLARDIPTSRLNSSNVLRYTAGGQFIGDLNADLTLSNISAGFTGQGGLATRNDVTWQTDFSAYPGDSVLFTSLGIAAGITGQGPFATSALAVADVTRQLNDGLALNPFFNDPSYSASGGIPPDWADWALGATLTRVTRDAWSGSGYAVYGNAAQPGFGNLGVLQQSQEVNPNGLYRMRHQWKRTGGSYAGAGMLIQWLDSNGTYISGATLACATHPPIGGGVSAYHDGKPVWDYIVQAPSNARRVNIYAMWSWTGMPGYTATDANRFQGECHECNLYPASEAERRTDTQEDGANVTGNHIAAGFTGQDFGATAGQDTVDNAYARVGGNAIQDPYFDQWGNDDFWGSDGSGPLNSVTVNLSNDNVPYLRVLGGTFTANSQYRRIRTPWRSNGEHAQFLNVQQGDRVGWAAMVGISNATGVLGYIEWRDANGSWVGANSVTRNIGTIGNGQGGRATFDYVDFYADAPAGAAFAFWAIRAYGDTGQAPDLRFFEAQLSRFAPGQVRMPPLIPGPGSTRRADQTAVGTAAAIAGQGGLATGNYYSQTGDPGSVPNGSFWHDSDDDVLYMRIGGIWEKIADVTPAGGTPFSATISPGYAEAARFGAGSVTTNNVTVSVQGGVGPFTFSWSYPTTTGIGISSLTAATVNFNKNLSANEYVSTTATCTVTDTGNGNAITQVQCGVNMVAL